MTDYLEKAVESASDAYMDWLSPVSRDAEECESDREPMQAVLPEPEFVAILFNPYIGAPLCRYLAHDAVEKKTDRIYWEDLSEECLEYVSSLPDFVLLRLEEECPKREAVA